MTRRWMLVAAALLMLATTAFAACGGDDDDGGNGDGGEFTDEPTEIVDVATPAVYPVQFVRSDGVTLSIESAPQKIVSLSPGATEILYAIGAEGAIAALDQESDYPEAAATFATKVDAATTTADALAALSPDLVIMDDDPTGLVPALDAMNIPVLYINTATDVNTIDEVLGQIRLYGQITDHADAALSVIDDIAARVAVIEERTQAVSTARGPKVYHETDAALHSVADTTFTGDMYAKLNARNIAGDGGGVPYPQLTQEKIFADAPDVIILATDDPAITLESVRARPGWNVVPAVGTDRVYPVDPDILHRPGPRIADGLEQLARRIYPTEFE